jgi:hypothetical protein
LRADLILLLLVALPLTGCPEDTSAAGAPRKMAIAKEQDAVLFMRHFFDAYVHVDVDSVSRMVCEQDPQSLGQVRAFIQHSQAEDSPFRVARYQVRSAVPMWIGKEPYFRGRGLVPAQSRSRRDPPPVPGAGTRWLRGGAARAWPRSPPFAAAGGLGRGAAR